MATPTLLVDAAFSLVVAILYAYVGSKLGRRRVEGTGRRAVVLFSVWWYALAGTSAITAFMSFLGSIDALTLPLYVAATYVNILLICLALWGLLYYLVYLFTGREGTLIPLGVFYVLYYLSLVYLIAAYQPAEVVVERWRTRLVYENPVQGPVAVALLLLLLVPQLLGALAYFTLYFRVDDPTQKYRVAVVSWSILVWFGSALAGSLVGVAEHYDWYQLVSRLIGLLAAVAILLAYEPPRWIRRRLGVRTLSSEIGTG